MENKIKNWIEELEDRYQEEYIISSAWEYVLVTKILYTIPDEIYSECQSYNEVEELFEKICDGISFPQIEDEFDRLVNKEIDFAFQMLGRKYLEIYRKHINTE